MIFEMSDLNLEHLIELIKSNRHLYDKSSKLFKNEQMKQVSYLEIGKTLNVSDNEVVRLWRSLRDRYTRERSAMDKTGAVESKWCYFNDMSFLGPHVRRRRRSDHQTMTSSSSPSFFMLNGEEHDLDVNEEDVEKNNDRKDSIVTKTDPAANEKDLVVIEDPLWLSSSTSARQDSFAQQNFDTTGGMVEERRTAEMRTASSAFGEYVARRLDEMSSIQARKCRRRIVEILEAE